MNHKRWITYSRLILAVLVAMLLISGSVSLYFITRINGNARVINYSGIVRGATQKLVKEELNQKPDDALIARLDGIIKELRTGRGDQNLVRLPDQKYQELLAKVNDSWLELKDAILLVRSGEGSNALYEKSETYFTLSDQMVLRAEQYASIQVGHTKGLILLLNGLVLLLVLLFIWYSSRHEKIQKQAEKIKEKNQKESERLSKMLIELQASMNEVSELMYVSDLENYDLLFINETGKQSFQVEDTKGRKCYEILQHRSEPCPFCTTPYLSQEENYTWEIDNAVTGQHYLLKDRLIEWDGKLARLEIAFDTTESANEKKKLKSALDAEQMIMQCIRILYRENHLEIAMNMVLKQLGMFLDAERSYVFRISGSEMSNVAEWCGKDSLPQIQNLQNLPITLIERWIPYFDNQECVVVEDLENIKQVSKEEYTVLHAQGIRSLVAAPLEENGVLSGYLGVDNPPVDRLKNIITLLQTLCYFISLAYHRDEDAEKLSRLSYYDTLTSFYNRNRFMQDLDKLAKHKGSLGVIYLDVNGLKDINDKLGHAFGDKILKQSADLMREVFQKADYYRIGGDEFVILCSAIEESVFAGKVAALQSAFAQEDSCKAAIGAKWVPQISHIQQIIADADEAMYADKKAFYHANPSSNRYRHHSDDVLHLADPDVLRESIKQDKFIVYLQPKVSSDTRAMVGAEALIRYRPQGDSVILPGNFLPILEESQSISQVDFFVFDFVCSKLSEWLKQGKHIMPISVNFSGCSLADPDFVAKLTAICAKHDVPKQYLEVEITENLKEIGGLKQLIKNVRQSGFTVSIDDFGTKRANLSLLSGIDLDCLKIDKSLVDDIYTNPKARKIIEAISDLCHELNIKLIAEGIETEEQLTVLKECGVSVGQGYLFERPIPTDEYESQYLD